MGEDNLLSGNFVYKDKVEFSALLQDYIEAISYFDELYTWAKELGQKDRITTDEFDEIEEALAVGGTALKRSAELSAKSISYDIKQMRRLTRSQAKQKRLDLETAVLRRRVDELRAIIYDPDKKIVPDNLEGRVE